MRSNWRVFCAVWNFFRFSMQVRKKRYTLNWGFGWCVSISNTFFDYRITHIQRYSYRKNLLAQERERTKQKKNGKRIKWLLHCNFWCDLMFCNNQLFSPLFRLSLIAYALYLGRTYFGTNVTVAIFFHYLVKIFRNEIFKPNKCSVFFPASF